MEAKEPASGRKELPTIPEGLSAVMLPEFGGRTERDQLYPLSPNNVLDQLNEFLSAISDQGAEIVTTLGVPVAKPGYANQPEIRQFAIVRKSRDK